MKHLSARLHAFAHGLFQPKPRALALEAYREVEARLAALGLTGKTQRLELARNLADDALSFLEASLPPNNQAVFYRFAEALFATERLFELPDFDWAADHSIAEYWALQDELKRIRLHVDDFDKTKRLIWTAFCHVFGTIVESCPWPTGDAADGAIIVPTDLVHAIGNLPQGVNDLLATFAQEEPQEYQLFPKLTDRLEANLIAASGGNPADSKSFSRAPKLPAQSDIKEPADLIRTYLGGTPLMDVFRQTIDFAIPEPVRFEHHHIVAGSGHGKTQTLQFLIAEDLKAVAEGRRSVIVIDSQGDLIRRISRLKLFAPGQPLHDRLVLIDPTDVEYPVSLNLFDVGLKRLDRYSQLDRERLTNSILELYDFVLGTLLSAEMTQKQNVIFRYVTRLMLHIPDATIHTLRELMEPKSELKFAGHMETLTGSAREFFRTEFASSEFAQTRKQVLRRLWGILENQTFERMFSHPRSKLDLFAEMNAGKVILINTAKDLLKEQGTEIFGRFFIAMIAQSAQERATLKEHQRMPTMVYIDEAADYFDRNVGIILSQARKYNVGMVLAHQYMGQLDPKLQEAIAANTSIKFAGGVSAKDSRQLAPMMSCTPELIESQPKGSFAAYLRGVTKQAIPLSFPLGHMERMEPMTGWEFDDLRQSMRKAYAVHYSELNGDPEVAGEEDEESGMETTATQPPDPETGKGHTKGGGEGRKRGSTKPSGDDGPATDW